MRTRAAPGCDKQEIIQIEHGHANHRHNSRSWSFDEAGPNSLSRIRCLDTAGPRKSGSRLSLLSCPLTPRPRVTPCRYHLFRTVPPARKNVADRIETFPRPEKTPAHHVRELRFRPPGQRSTFPKVVRSHPMVRKRDSHPSEERGRLEVVPLDAFAREFNALCALFGCRDVHCPCVADSGYCSAITQLGKFEAIGNSCQG